MDSAIVQDGKERNTYFIHRSKEVNSQSRSGARWCNGSNNDDTRLLKFEHKMSDPNADSKRAINVSQHPIIPSIGEMAIRC